MQLPSGDQAALTVDAGVSVAAVQAQVIASLALDNAWWHGSIERPEADARLLAGYRDGLFLIRANPSETHRLALSLLWHEEVLHFRIHFDTFSGYALGTAAVQFSSLRELVAHYTRHPVSQKTHMTLGVPCPRPANSAPDQQHLTLRFGLPVDPDQTWLALCLPDGSLLDMEDMQPLAPLMLAHGYECKTKIK